MTTKTTYQFAAFPANWWGSRGNYQMSCLSVFTFDTLREARREVARLRKIYAVKDRERARDPNNRAASLLKGYKDDEDYLTISRVDRTVVVPREKP